jgi:hypothetical protein
VKKGMGLPPIKTSISMMKFGMKFMPKGKLEITNPSCLKFTSAFARDITPSTSGNT